jgi:hypothetical protein
MIIKKDYYLLPLLNKVLIRIAKAKVYTKLDIKAAFNYIYVYLDSKEYTSFCI